MPEARDDSRTTRRRGRTSSRWYLRLLYLLYPPLSLLPEYREALNIARRYSCGRVVELGSARCNLGRLLLGRGLADLYVGVDLDPPPRPWDPRAACVQADALSPPLAGTFDCAFFINSLFYIGLRALRAYLSLARVVVIIDIEPTPRYLLNYLGDAAEGRIRMTYADLGRALAELGASVLESRRGAQYYYVIARPTASESCEQAREAHAPL